MVLENDLRKALVRDEFCLYFQPQVEVQGGRVVGAEALLRWAHLERGLLAPAHFIRLAEDTGLIRELGKKVLRESCRQAKEWREAGLDLSRVSLNLSAREFADPQLPFRIEQTLRDADLAPECLGVEVTETALMENLEQAWKTLEVLKEMGIHLAVDDFGTGYSSLSYLKKLPVHMLKIDRSFLKDVPESRNGRSLVSAIIAMGRNLGLQVLVEGVTNEDQWKFLQAHDGLEMQGYLFSPPLPPNEFAQFARESNRVETMGSSALGASLAAETGD
jgi:EAL domain-containing protein (putative c-di-GMP-specific phosphodiesterase class I)